MTRSEVVRFGGGVLLGALSLLLAIPPAGADDSRIRAIGPIHIIRPPGGSDHREVFTASEVRDLAEEFLDTACDPGVIREFLGRRYRFLGYIPAIEAECIEGTLSLTIRESSHAVTLITFEPVELSRIGVVPDPEYQDPRRFFVVPEGRWRTIALGLLTTREGDLYNRNRYMNDAAALGFAGFTVAFIPGPSTDIGSYPGGAYLIQSLTLRDDNRPRHKGKTNYVGGTASFQPRERATVGVTYQKRQLFGRTDTLTITPTYNTAIGLNLTYQAPLLADRTEPKRLYDVRFSLYSNFLHNRVLSGVETDQRVTGASITLGAQPLGLRAPHGLRYLIGAAFENVSFDQTAPGLMDSDIVTLSVGFTYNFNRTFRSPNLSARFTPRLDFSADITGDTRRFTRFVLDSVVHPRLPSGIEFDIHFRGGVIEGDAPQFELWSLGGATTVRGFELDTFLGADMAALQTEIWIPFVRPLPQRPVTPGEPLPDMADVPIEPKAARLLRWALFVDGGYVNGIPPTGRDDSLIGVGIGLRFVVPGRPLVMRIDYGWGVGGNGGDAFPYLSLGYRF